MRHPPYRRSDDGALQYRKDQHRNTAHVDNLLRSIYLQLCGARRRREKKLPTRRRAASRCAPTTPSRPSLRRGSASCACGAYMVMALLPSTWSAAEFAHASDFDATPDAAALAAITNASPDHSRQRDPCR